jgi:hypothetical protein
VPTGSECTRISCPFLSLVNETALSFFCGAIVSEFIRPSASVGSRSFSLDMFVEFYKPAIFMPFQSFLTDSPGFDILRAFRPRDHSVISTIKKPFPAMRNADSRFMWSYGRRLATTRTPMS